jgi:hypothetical protein
MTLVASGPAVAAKKQPTVKFDAPICASGLGVSFNGTINWKSGPVGTASVNWGDGTTTASSFPDWHVYAEPGTYPVTLTVTNTHGSGTATTSVTVGSGTATCVYTASPEPIAEAGTMGSDQSAPVVVKVTNAKGTTIKAQEPVWLSFAPAPGGGTATACCTASGATTPLATTPNMLTTGGNEPAGEVMVTYTTSATPPDSGSDVITAAGVPDAAAGEPTSTGYQYASSPIPLTPPSTIASDCSVDVSKSLGPWLRNLPPNSTVDTQGDCYQVDEGLYLDNPAPVTINGGTFENESTTPVSTGNPGTQRGDPVFNVLSGSGLTLENMAIDGANPGGYLAKMAFASGIQLQGTHDANISNVTITDTFGDGITLDPLRNASDHEGSGILSPTDNATISNVTINGAGRMGISFVSVDVASVTTVNVSNVGLDTFDVEADQGDEGAQGVTIDGCTASNPENSNLQRAFFANGGLSSGNNKGSVSVTVENCVMDMAQGNTAVEVLRPTNYNVPRGPFMFVDDTFYCGQGTSTSTASCVEVSGGTVTMAGSTFVYPDSSPYENVYSITNGSDLTFTNEFSNDTTATGFGGCGASNPTGTSDSTSSFTNTGGTWPPPSC